MKSTLVMLLKLSETDAKIVELREQSGHVPAAIQEITSRINVLESEIRAAENKKDSLAAAKKEAEDFIAEKRQWIETRESQVKDIKTNKEYHAALKEVSLAKKEILDREAQIAAFTQQSEQIQSEVETVRGKNAAEIESLKAQIAEHEAQIATLKPQLDELSRARGGITVEIDPKILAQYEQILARVVPAIAKADNFICTECGNKILPQLFNRLHTLKEILPCPRCKRILYVEETLKA